MVYTASLRCGALLVLVGVAACGCSGSGGAGPSDEPPPVHRRIYVDGAYSGAEDGTAARPYNTVQEAVDVAGDGDVVVIAAGDYDLGGGLVLAEAVSFRGEGMDSTELIGGVSVGALSDSLECRFACMTLPSVTFGIDCPNGPVPIMIDSCHVAAVSVWRPGSHSYSVLNSVIDGSVSVADAGGVARNVLRNCSVGGDVRYSSGDGDIVNVVEDCEIAGGISTSCGDGTSLIIRRNTIGRDIRDSNGRWYTLIADNVIAEGIMDASGGAIDGTEDCIIERNILGSGVTTSSAGMSFRDNRVTYTTYGVLSSSGPTNITGNTFTRNPAWRGRAGACLYLSCGAGSVSGNSIEGARYGILAHCRSTTFEDNAVAGADTGVVLTGAVAFVGNTITGSTGDGLVVWGPIGRVSGCTVSDNGGSGVVLRHPADMGGGADGSTGMNVFTGNGNYDLRVACPAESAAVIHARWNTWDHADSAGVAEDDIYDGLDDPILGLVRFVPVGAP